MLISWILCRKILYEYRKRMIQIFWIHSGASLMTHSCLKSHIVGVQYLPDWNKKLVFLDIQYFDVIDSLGLCSERTVPLDVKSNKIVCSKNLTIEYSESWFLTEILFIILIVNFTSLISYLMYMRSALRRSFISDFLLQYGNLLDGWL